MVEYISLRAPTEHVAQEIKRLYCELQNAKKWAQTYPGAADRVAQRIGELESALPNWKDYI